MANNPVQPLTLAQANKIRADLYPRYPNAQIEGWQLYYHEYCVTAIDCAGVRRIYRTSGDME